jgi:hypothetical protein
MECLNDGVKLEVLQHANDSFAPFFERFAGVTVAASEEELPALLQLQQALDSVSALLDGRLQGASSNEVRVALDCYRRNLMRLHSQLASMQQSALAYRKRLDYRQAHLHRARAWCTGSRAIG